MKNVWGWEKPEDRLKRYARVSAKRKLDALEQMRLFVSKYQIVDRQLVQRVAV